MPFSDDDLFAQAMAAVRPMREAERIQPPKKSPPHADQLTLHTPKQPRPLHTMPAPQEMGDWVLRADGTPPDALKKLANGTPAAQHHLDLHGCTHSEALLELEACFHATIQAKGRVLRVIHGRGLHSPRGKPVLKRAVYDWLRCGSMAGYVLAAIPCPDSGGGACLILLRRDKRNSFRL